MTLWFALVTVLLCVQVFLVLMVMFNAVTIPRLGSDRRRIRTSSPPASQVDILIPARNEAHRLPATLEHLLPQVPPGSSIWVLDDNSSDGTRQVVERFQSTDRRLRLLPGKPLPPGWNGKNWACQQLSLAAKNELLLFTDADVLWQSGSLQSVLDAAQDLRADMLTVWPTQKMDTLAERLVIPMMTYSTLAYLPWVGVHRLPFASMAAANGQCILFRRDAYLAVGGHQSVSSSIIEDVDLARRIKKHGLRLRMLDGSDQVTCRMYTGWKETRNGYAKNILAGHASSPGLLLLSTIFHWLVFLFPWLWLATGWLFPSWPLPEQNLWPLWPLVMVSLTTGSRLLSAAVSRQPLRDAFLLPVSVILMTVIAVYALRWHYSQGGPDWKGRKVSTNNRRTRRAGP